MMTESRLVTQIATKVGMCCSRLAVLRARTTMLVSAGILQAALAPAFSQSIVEFTEPAFVTGDNAGSVSIHVRRTGSLDTTVGVHFATMNNTAVAGVDYLAVSEQLVFEPGEAYQTVSVSILNDNLAGSTRTFRTRLSSPTSGAVIGTLSQAAVYIANPDEGVSFRFNSYSVAEGVGTAVLGIVRGDDGIDPISVDLVTSDVSAISGHDYAGTNRTVVLPGNRRLTFVNVPIFNNHLKDGNRSFRVRLRNPVGGMLGCTSIATVWINDDDPGFEFASDQYTVSEDVRYATIDVQRGSDETATSVAVDYTFSDATASNGVDYSGISGTLVFDPGAQRAALQIPILNDGIKENAEVFRLMLSVPSPGTVLGPRTNTTVLIQDNDAGPGFDTSIYSVWEGAGEITVAVVRGNDGNDQPFTVTYACVAGTAVAGDDYSAVAGTLDFAAWDTVKGITVPILPDIVAEGSQTFQVTLTDPTGGVPLAIATATVDIQDRWALVAPFASGLGISRGEGGTHSLTWPGDGRLQRADRLSGPWHTLDSGSRPHRAATRNSTTFYRLRNDREVRLYVPSSYTPQEPMPLILLLHGYGDSGQGVEDYMRFQPLAETQGFLYCFPDGSIDRFGNRSWNADDHSMDPGRDWGEAGPDDASYLRDLIAEIQQQFAVDPKRIYVTGRSNGGAMAYRMACQYADLVAGIMSHAGISYFETPWCVPSEPVNVLRLQSYADNYFGGHLTLCDGFFYNVLPNPSVLRTVATWADYNGASEPVTDYDPTLDLILDVSGRDTLVTRYTNHPPGGAVELWTMISGPHKPSLSRSYARLIIDWLLTHPKP